MWNLRSWCVVGMMAAGAAGGTARAQSPDPAQPPATRSDVDEACRLRDARTVVSDTRGGVAITFTTTNDVEELRAHVRHMADMRNHMTARMMDRRGMGRRGRPGAGMGMRGGADMPGGMGMMMPMVPARAVVRAVPGGARLILTPTDPGNLAALRDDARARAAMMQQRPCPPR